MVLQVIKQRDIEVGIDGISTRALQLGSALVRAIGSSAQTQSSILANKSFPAPVVLDPDPAVFSRDGAFVNTVSGLRREYEAGDEVSSPDSSIGNVYVFLADGSDPIDNRDGRRGDAEFEVAVESDIIFEGNSGGRPVIIVNFIPENLPTYNPNSVAVQTGSVTLESTSDFNWDGDYMIDGVESPMKQATLLSGGGSKKQVWMLEPRVTNLQNLNGIIIFAAKAFDGVTLTGKFNGMLSYHLTDTVPDPDEEQAYRTNPLLPAPDYPYWSIRRKINALSLTDRRPQVPVGKDDLIAISITKETPFDSVALVNCECLEAEVVLPRTDTCQVQGVDGHGDANAQFILSLTCIGNAPNTGTGLMDGVITLRSDTNFTWDGVGATSIFVTPYPLVATRMPNDGANNAMVQHWIVKGAVFDFTKLGIITINNAIGGSNFTGSFEGVVSYEVQTTITQTPDAVLEPSDLLFTDLQPIANDAGKYTATINVKNPNQKALLGNLVIGSKETIGNLVLSNGFEIVGLDFSTINTNLFGELQTTERPATTTMKFQIRILRTEIQHATRFFTELKSGTPALFQLTDNPLIGTRLFGWVRTFRITMDKRKDYAIVTATIQGLV